MGLYVRVSTVTTQEDSSSCCTRLLGGLGPAVATTSWASCPCSLHHDVRDLPQYSRNCYTLNPYTLNPVTYFRTRMSTHMLTLLQVLVLVGSAPSHQTRMQALEPPSAPAPQNVGAAWTMRSTHPAKSTSEFQAPRCLHLPPTAFQLYPSACFAVDLPERPAPGSSCAPDCDHIQIVNGPTIAVRRCRAGCSPFCT